MRNNIEMEQFLIYLRGIIKNMQKIFNSELKAYNISSGHLVYMMLLSHHKEGLTMTELSNMSQVDKALTSRVIKELEEINYVYRDTKNKYLRNYNVCLTEKGLEVANEINNIIKKQKKEILKDFSISEQKQIYEVIEMFMNKLSIKE